MFKDTTHTGATLSLDGVSYDKGLWMNAEASIDYYLGGRCARLVADLGIDDSASREGSVVYEVWAGSKRIFQSGVVSKATPTQRLDLDVSGVEAVWLNVTDAGDGFRSDNAVLGNARLSCGG